MKKFLAAVFLAALATTPALADATILSVVTTPKGADVDVGEPCVLAITLTGSRVGGRIELPKVDGLEVDYSGMYYDSFSETFKYYLVPKHEGDFTISSFTIKTQAGETLTVNPVKIHCPRIHAD